MAPSDVPDSPITYEMVIDGESTSSRSGDRFEVEFPYTQDVWATVPEATPDDVDRAVRAARERYERDAWQARSATERGKLLFSLADIIEDHIDELARLETLGNGKLVRETRGQAESLPDWYRYYGGLADKIHGKTIPVEQDGFFTFTKKEPYGVVAGITPWNSPLLLATYKIAPAIATGNTVVIKPSEVAPVSTIRLAELAREAGFPDGALNVVTGYGDVGAALTEHDEVDKLTLTGGLETGHKVGSAAGENIVPVTLELGGKSPNIVFPDADLDNAVKGTIKGIFAATGQSCVAGSRLFVHESIEDAFVNRLVERTETIEWGDPLDPATEIATVASEAQFEKVKKYVEVAKEEGANILTGGTPRWTASENLFFPPTVVTGVTNDMRIAGEEVFGPLLSVLTFESEEGVLRKANDSPFGLAAGVWTNDIQRGIRMAERLKAGVVWVNTYRKSSFTVPFGGFKDSGIGREKGTEAIEEYLQTKSVWIKTEGDVSDPFRMI